MKGVAYLQNVSNPTWALDSDDRVFVRDGVHIVLGDVLNWYDRWPSPTVIISDGPYGVSGFPGDPPTPHTLAQWYEPHIAAWSKAATFATTLWFWNSEHGWANVHGLLQRYGWSFVNCHIWNKGISHVAGNSNTKTLHKYPVVTEVCVQYVRKVEFRVGHRVMSMQEWLRYEWERSGLPFSRADEAAGTKNAATRKYLTKDHLWYCPPPEAFERLVAYTNQYGDPNGHPYFSLDGKCPLTATEWANMRPKFYCKPGITNVWDEPPVRGPERIKVPGRVNKALHANQKPLKLAERIIRASSDPEDVVWAPFGGLCTEAIASHKLGRVHYGAEVNPRYFEIAVERLKTYDRSYDTSA